MEKMKICKGSASRLRMVDHNETYGSHVIDQFLSSVNEARRILDVGAGGGRDLNLAKQHFPTAVLNAVECFPPNIQILCQQGITAHALNIENDPLPFENESFDIVIVNQILEHTKELFWILHEITRVLKVGGYLFAGVPNIASLHNRIGLLFGKHPTQFKSYSAHVRCFSKADFLLFFQETFPGGYELEAFRGSQFYPFPGRLARLFSTLLPTMSFSIFFSLRKLTSYEDSILRYPVKGHLETNFRTE